MANAIELLTQDHDNVRALLKELTDTPNNAHKKREELLGKIRKELEVHTKLEEEIFYPAFRHADGRSEHSELYHEAMEEHHLVEDMVIPDVGSADVGSDEFAGRAKVLRELVEHHAEDEEEEMFPMARKAMTESELEELGEKMQARKQELQQGG